MWLAYIKAYSKRLRQTMINWQKAFVERANILVDEIIRSKVNDKACMMVKDKILADKWNKVWEKVRPNVLSGFAERLKYAAREDVVLNV